MFGNRIELFEVLGFKVRIDPSWFFIVVLVAWSLAAGYFPTAVEDLSTVTYWVMGVVGALGLFVAVVVHELSHSLVARRHGVHMEGITLFIFGGVAEMREEPRSPKSELLIALAGPAASVGIAVVCFLAAFTGAALGWGEPVLAVIQYLAVINLVVVAFNMIPAFPLDGGRVLRSILWRAKDNLKWATQVTSRVGAGFGAVLMGLGVISLLMGNFVGGMWLFLIGLFLRGAAQMGYRQLLLRRALEGEPVRRFMKSDPVTVPRAISVRELVESYIYRQHHKMYPVVDGERLLGCVTTREVKELPREEWERQTVGAIASGCSEENSVSPETDAMEAMAKMRSTGASRLMVVEDGRLVGVLTLKDLLEFLSMRIELGEE